MSKVLHMYDEFKIVKERSLHAFEFENISLMYLPLIGMDAMGLYLILQSLPASESMTHKILYDLLNLQNISIINHAKEKLEAIGLVETYFSENKGFVYVLRPPLSKEAFSKDIILRHALMNQIGEQYIENITKKANISLRGYKKETKKFSDVFDLDTTHSSLISDEILEKIASTIEIDHPNFDLIVFKEMIGDHFISSELLEDVEFQENIYRMSYLYNLDEEDMKIAIMKSIDVDKDFNYEVLSKHCRKLFQNKNKDKAIYFTTKKSDPFIKHNDLKMTELIHKVESMNPRELLQNLSGITPSASELKIVEDLMKNTKFSTGVINWMLLMVIQTKDGIMPTYNYFEKIANVWARAKIQTVSQAIEFSMRSQEKTAKSQDKKYPTRSAKKVADVPDWYEDYEKQLEDYMKATDEKMSEEEIQKTLEDAKKIFG